VGNHLEEERGAVVREPAEAAWATNSRADCIPSRSAALAAGAGVPEEGRGSIRS
jgi:hypothetical protein